MKTSLITAMVALVLTAPAIGQEMPRFDVEKHCREVADFSNGSSVLYNSCISMEQEAYDKRKRTWQDLPSQTREHCTEIASFTGGSYSLLDSCIGMELEAAGNTPSFKF